MTTDNTLGRRLPIRAALLVAALACRLNVLQAAEPALKPLYPGILPACSCESLTNLSLPNTTVESAVVDPSNRMCRVTAIVTHPPAGGRVKVWVGLPLTNWNGRFQGTGGGGFLGGHPNSLRGPVRQGFSGPGARPTGINEALIRWVEEARPPTKSSPKNATRAARSSARARCFPTRKSPNTKGAAARTRRRILGAKILG